MKAVLNQVKDARALKALIAKAANVEQKQGFHEDFQAAMMKLPLEQLESLLITYGAIVAKAQHE